MKRFALLMCCLTLSLSFNSFAQDPELDPPAVEGIVVKLNEKTNKYEAFKVTSDLFDSGIDKEQAKDLVEKDLKGAVKISGLLSLDADDEDELNKERSVGNFYYYYHNWNNGFAWNRGWFHYNRWQFNYGFNTYWLGYRYHWYW